MSFLSVDGCEVFYEESGSGVPVVLTPAGGDPGTSMLPLAKRLSDRYRVIVWSPPNSGLSGIDLRGASHRDLGAKALAALLTELGAVPAIVAAPAEGARLALRAATRTPDLVRGLFLWQLVAEPVKGVLREAFHDEWAAMAELSGMEAVAYTPWFVERSRYLPRIWDEVREIDPEEFAAVQRAWASELREDSPSALEELASVSALVWVVAGVGETYPSEASLRRALEPGDGKRVVAAPYTEDDWQRSIFVPDDPAASPPPGAPTALDFPATYRNDTWQRVFHNPAFALYATLPGVAELLSDFAATFAGGGD